MQVLDPGITRHVESMLLAGIEHCPVFTNPQGDPALPCKPLKVAGDKFDLAMLMMLLIRQGLVLSQ